MGKAVGFCALNVGMFPTPVEDKPIAAFEFVQSNVEFPIGPKTGTLGTTVPSQTTMLFSANTEGSGFTTI